MLIVDGYSNHDWQRTTPARARHLERSGVCEASVATVPTDTSEPAYARWLPAFKNFDVVVQTCNDLGGKGPLWPTPARTAFEEFVKTGGGVFVLHSGNNAFADWDAYNHIIGLGWRPKTYGTALRVRADESIERIPPGEGSGTSHGARTDRVIHRLGDDPIHAGLPRTWKTPLIEVYTYARGPAENVTCPPGPRTRSRGTLAHRMDGDATARGACFNSTFGHVWRDEADPVDMRRRRFPDDLLSVRCNGWQNNRSRSHPHRFPYGGSDSAPATVAGGSGCACPLFWKPGANSLSRQRESPVGVLSTFGFGPRRRALPKDGRATSERRPARFKSTVRTRFNPIVTIPPSLSLPVVFLDAHP